MNPEQDQGGHIPTLDEASTAYSEVMQYNHTCANRWRTVSNALLSFMTEKSEDADDLPVFISPDGDVIDMNIVRAKEEGNVQNSKDASRSTEELVTEGDMNRDLLDILYRDTLIHIGIALDPVGHASTAEGERITSEMLEPIIADAASYRTFLATLQPGQVSPSKTPLLANVLANLLYAVNASQVRGESTESRANKDTVPADGSEELYTFALIASEYERLGMDAASLRTESDDSAQSTMAVYERLETCVSYWERHLLPEYLEGAEYIKPPEDQHFGPANWHYDGGQAGWMKAFAFLARLEQNERTRDFADEVRAGLIASVDAARAPAKEAYSDRADGQRDDLLNVRRFLTGEDYNADRLAVYISGPQPA